MKRTQFIFLVIAFLFAMLFNFADFDVGKTAKSSVSIENSIDTEKSFNEYSHFACNKCEYFLMNDTNYKIIEPHNVSGPVNYIINDYRADINYIWHPLIC